MLWQRTPSLELAFDTISVGWWRRAAGCRVLWPTRDIPRYGHNIASQRTNIEKKKCDIQAPNSLISNRYTRRQVYRTHRWQVAVSSPRRGKKKTDACISSFSMMKYATRRWKNWVRRRHPLPIASAQTNIVFLPRCHLLPCEKWRQSFLFWEGARRVEEETSSGDTSRGPEMWLKCNYSCAWAVQRADIGKKLFIICIET